jgi:hypothetical protein
MRGMREREMRGNGDKCAGGHMIFIEIKDKKYIPSR